MASDTAKAFAMGCGITAGAGVVLVLLLAVVGAMVGNPDEGGNRMRTEAPPPAPRPSSSSSAEVATPHRETPTILELERKPKESKQEQIALEEPKPAFTLYEGMLLSTLEDELGEGRRTRRLGGAATYVWQTVGGILEATFEKDELVDWSVGGVQRGSIPSAEAQWETLQTERANEERARAEEAAREQQANEGKWAEDEARQPERMEFIQKMIKQGVFRKVEFRDTGATVWVDSSFYVLDFGAKQDFVSVVYAYLLTDTKDKFAGVRLRDSKSGNTVGEYHKWTGLRMK